MRVRTVTGLVAAALAGACGPGGEAGGKGPAEPATPALLPQEQVFSLDEIEVAGIALGPEALSLPVMTQVTRRGANLDRYRRRAARKNPDPDDVRVLVTLLWNAADRTASVDAAAARALRDEGRTALRALRAARGDQVSAVTLEMLGAAELWLGDEPAAIAAYEELVRRHAEHPAARARRVTLGHLYLRQRRIADAAALVASWNPADLDEHGHYVAAWTAFATGDGAAARAAIARAAAGWREPSTRPVLDRDLLVMLARTGAEVEEAARLIAEVTGDAARRRYVLTFRLSEAYEEAGRYAEAAATLDLVIDRVMKGEVPPDDLVGFRFRQADYAFRLGDPAVAADRAIAAHQALAACGDQCPESTRSAVTERLLKLAQFSHTVFARSLDPRHLQAAARLYDHYLAIAGRPDAETVRTYRRNLEETRASADPNGGKHDAEVMLNTLRARREVVAACYEQVLLREPTLEGMLLLTLEIDQSGAVAQSATDPAAGAEGVAAVAECVAERAAAWRFPSRTVPGTTRLQASFRLGLQPAGS